MSKNRRILVIDDNPSVHRDFRSTLTPPDRDSEHLQDMEEELFGQKTDKRQKTSFELDCASQGKEGLAMVVDALKEGRPYAMAFVDIRMPPGWDGVETVQRIWAEYPALQVVICTAYSDYSWDNITKTLGHSDQLLILKKPFDTIEVMQLALALTEKWNLTQRSQAHIEEVERQVLEQTRDLQEFAYGVSHDLQEPLRKVMTFGDRLRDKCGDQLGEVGNDCLNRMQDATKRMSVLIHDLLALSRVTTRGKPPISVDLKTIVSEVLTDLEVLVERTQGKVEVGNLPTIDADPTQMRQLFQNLIGNALKFRKRDGAPLIRISAERVREVNNFTDETEEETRWQIKVQDNGIGFDEKYREKIFEVFQRLHGRTEYEGSGIGLSLVRKIISRHGGSISAQSKPGDGATFLITLPEKQREPKSNAKLNVTLSHTETASGAEKAAPAKGAQRTAPSDKVLK
jgi:signal transduction histidine kinase